MKQDTSETTTTMRPMLRHRARSFCLCVTITSLALAISLGAVQPAQAPAQDDAKALAIRASSARIAGDARLALALYTASLTLRDNADVRNRLHEVALSISPGSVNGASLDIAERVNDETLRREELERRLHEIDQRFAGPSGVERRLERIENDRNNDGNAESRVDRLERDVHELRREVNQNTHDINRLRQDLSRLQSRIR